MAAAAVSAFFVPPSPKYLTYLDLRVLCLLLSLMLVVAGLQRAGAFDVIVDRLLRFAHNTRSLSAVLVGVCFFSGMLITNDVALITFVPLTVMLLTRARKTDLLIPIIALQTIGANLGSMLTPLGSPQNLYLYALSGMTVWQFIKTMALPSAISLVLLTAAVFLIKPRTIETPEKTRTIGVGKKHIITWAALFAVCLLAVVYIVPYGAALTVVAAAALLVDRPVLRRVDYGLLLTFVFLFIFIGNIKSLPAVSQALSSIVDGRELPVSIVLSQFISNVPAAMLLSGFTSDYPMLLTGVNLGGLGTLIASMASVISYKQYAAVSGARPGRYIAVFTALCLAFLAVLWPVMALYMAA
ncbi:MAG: citrate transporter [Clostridia bacterium]|nr:citrate transporter [Clostridia bacterium]